MYFVVKLKLNFGEKFTKFVHVYLTTSTWTNYYTASNYYLRCFMKNIQMQLEMKIQIKQWCSNRNYQMTKYSKYTFQAMF